MGLRRTGFSPVLSLLMPACSLLAAPPLLTGMASTLTRTLSYRVPFYLIRCQSKAPPATLTLCSLQQRALAALVPRAYRRGKLSVSVAIGTCSNSVYYSTPTASVSILAPLYFRRRIARPVSCYAFFKGWLLLSQPPGCLGLSTSFPTE